jgi:tetratricopeptide (TPR) repeat protein
VATYIRVTMYRVQSSSDIPLVSASGPSIRSLAGGASLSRPRRLAGAGGTTGPLTAAMDRLASPSWCPCPCPESGTLARRSHPRIAMTATKPPERPKVTSLLDRLPPARRARHLATLAFRDQVHDRAMLSMLGDWAAELEGVDEEATIAELERMGAESGELLTAKVACLALRAAKRYLRGEREEALVAWAAIVEAHPQHAARPLESRATFRMLLGELDLALQDVTRSIELAPTVASSYALRGDVYTLLLRDDEALANYERALQLDQDDHQALQGTARALCRRHEEERAIALVSRAIERRPRKPGLHAERARCSALLHRDAEAIADLDVAIAIEPDVAELYVSRARCRPMEDHDARAADFARALELDPGDAHAWADLAHHRQETGQLEEALRAAERAVALDPELAITYFSRALARHALGDHAGALADFDEVVRIDPSEPGHFACRGMVHEALGDRRAYLADLETTTVLDPENFALRVMYARLLAEERDYERCLREFEAALSIGGEALGEAARAELHFFVAGALARLGRFEEAILRAELAVSLDPAEEEYRARAARYRAKREKGA